jgi:shikimate kinase
MGATMTIQKRKNPKHNYLLLGIPSVGKRTIGKIVAEKLKMKFVDTDRIVMSEFLAESGSMPAFRTFLNGFAERQRDVIANLSHSSVDTILAIGAEAVPQLCNHEPIKNAGTVILIKRNPEKLRSSERFQFVNVNNKNNPFELADKLYNEYLKIPDYDMLADVTIDNDGTIEECVEKVIRFIESAHEIHA